MKETTSLYSLGLGKGLVMPALVLTLLGCSLAQLTAQEEWKSLPPTKVSEAITSQIESHPDITYAVYGERALQLDLYQPKNREEDQLLPAIVCIHGGGWAKGSRRNHAHIAQALAARGYVTVSISYRLSGEAPFPAQIQDAKAAVRWLRAHAAEWGIDPDAIGATGLSAGGHLTALLATSGGVDELEGEGGNASQSSTIQAAVPMGAQSDLETERIRLRSREAEIYQAFLSGTQEEQPTTYQLASPRHHLTSDDPPTFFITGELDDPSTHADQFRADYANLEIPTGLKVIDGAPHPFLTKQKFFDIAVEQIDAFFARHLARSKD